jgi:UPF0755 protein
MFRSLFKKCDVIFIIIIAFLFYISFPVASKKTLFIPQGSLSSTINHLRSLQFDIGKPDKLFIHFLGAPQSGWIDIGTEKLTKLDFLYRLTHAKASTTNITLIPGETTEIFLDDISKKLGLNLEKLTDLYRQTTQYPDGLLMPDTYNIPKSITEESLIEHLYAAAMQRHQRLSHTIFGSFNEKKWFKYIIIASIIQKEAANNEEMPTVSSVIHNRLKKGMRLQMDGTLNYGRYSHIKVTPERIKNDTSRYNTYKYKGIPPHAVSTVSTEAIQAAIFPQKTDYLYFVKGKDGTHNFSKSYKSHIRNIKSVK